jgi:hypothetical protein
LIGRRSSFGWGEGQMTKSPRKPRTLVDDAELKELSGHGITCAEIARTLNRSIAAVEVRASTLGIKLTSSLPKSPEGQSIEGTKPTAATRLRKYFESLAYGKRTGRVAYVMDTRSMPTPMKGAEWVEDKGFSAANEILARPALKAVFASALRSGCATETER